MTSDQPIPEEYKSWSLFLVCNPAWAVPEQESSLRSLYDQFQAFGRALGPEHVAVWFWRSSYGQEEDDQEDLHTAVSLMRSGAFCDHLDLPPGESPYVVVTTEYPGKGRLSSYPDTFRELENRYVLALNGLPAAEATEVLTRLADKIYEERFSEIESGSEGYWRRWQQIFEGLQSGLVDFSERVQVSINTQFFAVELSRQE